MPNFHLFQTFSEIQMDKAKLGSLLSGTKQPEARMKL
jgi:hypothetical protein